MNWKYYTAAGLIVLAFASGRFLAPTKTVVQTVEVEKKQTDAEREKHKTTTTTVTEKPDGTKTTVTATTEDSNTKKSTKDDTTTDTTSTKTYGGSKTNISALAGVSLGSGIPVTYGAEVSKSILGPIRAGVWGLTSGTFGVSLGLEF
jgi:hypothetical protein